MRKLKLQIPPAVWTTLFSLALLVLLLVPAGTASAQSLTGNVQIVDRYGNITTNISNDALANAGIELGDMVLLNAGNFSGVVPVVSNYADVQRGDPLVRVADGVIMLAISYGNFSEANAVAEGLAVAISLAEKGAYKAELEIRSLVRTEERSDYASDAVFANFREARLGSIPANILYRSCHPALDDARAPYAARLAEQARINTVINLADTPEELLLHAASVPWYQTFIDRGNIITLGMGVDYKSPDFTGKLKAGLEFMLTRNAPYLIHCNEGKDRAGVTVALLGALMGATPDEIVDDYMLSYENYYGVSKGEERYTLISSIMLDILKDLNGGTAPKAGETAVAAEKYLSEVIGFSPAQISGLKSKLAGN